MTSAESLRTKMKLIMELKDLSYDIIIERGVLTSAGEHLDLDRKVLVVTDSGVPKEYAKTVKSSCREGYIYTIPAGESSKCFSVLEDILAFMLENGFSRKDCVVAVGGGVVGDLAGFAAAVYMRGIDFYNIPTTILSQVDSSIGGKVAIDFHGFKNTIGAFHQPKAVLIDPDTIKTLSDRQVANGLAEALKTGAIGDEKLFDLFEGDDIYGKIDEIIYRSLLVKRDVVQQDPNEKGIRKILNFGHTVGHGIETSLEGELIHGECVALGMLYVCPEDIKSRLLGIYEKIGLTKTIGKYIDGTKLDREKVLEAMRHDKKAAGDMCDAVLVDKIGEAKIEKRRIDELLA